MSGDGVKNGVLAGLAALAVASSAFAIWTVNRPHPSLGDMAEPTADSVAQTGQTDDSSAASAAPETAQETAETGEAEATESPETVSPAGWVAATEGDDSDLMVVGDGYSNLPSQWIQQWGVALSEDRPVTIRHWGEAADRSFNEPIELSTGAGPSLSIWSASRDGSTIMDAVERLDRFDRASADPEAVLISLGQRSGGEDIPAAMDELLAGLPEVPVLLVVGPTDLYAAGVGDALADWGADNEERVVTVDLREATSGSPTAEEWAQAFQEALAG